VEQVHFCGTALHFVEQFYTLWNSSTFLGQKVELIHIVRITCLSRTVAPRKNGTGIESGSRFQKFWNSDSHHGTYVTKFEGNDLNFMLFPIAEQYSNACYIKANFQKIHKSDPNQLFYFKSYRRSYSLLVAILDSCLKDDIYSLNSTAATSINFPHRGEGGPDTAAEHCKIGWTLRRNHMTFTLLWTLRRNSRVEHMLLLS
jgi:hypothetical protein